MFNFDLNTVNKEGSLKGNFNGKLLKYNTSEDTESGIPTEVAALSPENLDELNETASIIDVIIQLLTGDENTLVRTDHKTWSDRNITSDGYKVTVTGENGEGVSYDPTDHFANNKLTLNHESIVSRLDTIEKVLQLLSLKVQNKLDFRTISVRTDASPYHNVTSIDDFFNYVENVFGITFEKNGFYATERKQDIKAESIKEIQGKDNKKETLDLYNIIYDAVKRIKNNEWALKYNEVVLGSDYDDYLDTNRTKDTYEDLVETEPTHTKKYTVTSDMKAILKLLYGADKEPNADDNNNHTTYNHFEVANEKADNFTKSSILDGGVSVLDCLYTQLYNVPKVVNADGSQNTDAYNDMEGYNALWYDPVSPRATAAVKDANNNSLLGMGRRSKFIAQAVTDHPLSRIDILENTVSAIYKYIGFGSNTNTHYYSGEFTFKDETNAVPSELWGSLSATEDIKENVGAKVSINGNTKYDVHNRYHTLSSNYHLSAIALQAYFNTVDIASLLFEVKEGKRDPSPYSKNEQEAIVANTQYGNIESDKTTISVKSAYASSFSSYSVATSIKKLLEYAADIDKDLMEFKKKVLEDIDVRIENDNLIWKVIGIDYSFNDTSTKDPISKRLNDIENDIGEDSDTSVNGTIKGKINTYGDDIADLKDGLLNLQKSNEAVINSIKNVDDDTAKFESSDDVVYKTFKKSDAVDAIDDITDDTFVLATKASVESLVEKAVDELRNEMKESIQNNRKLAAMMAYMKCDDINANENAVKFVRSGESWNGYDMQEKELAFKVGGGTTGKLTAGVHKKYCGEDMIEIELEDYVDHLKFKAYVPYKEGITATVMYENQTFKYGSNNNATSLDDDSYIVKIY